MSTIMEITILGDQGTCEIEDYLYIDDTLNCMVISGSL